MIIIDSTNKTLQISLSSSATTSEFQFVTSYADNLASTGFTSGEIAGTTNGTTNVTILPSPPSLAQRQLKFMSIYNADTVSNVVTLYMVSGASITTICKYNVLPNQTLVYDQDSGFQLLSSQSLYIQSVGALGNLFTGGTALNPTIQITTTPTFTGLTATTISASTYQGLPSFASSFTGSTTIYFGFYEDGYTSTAVTNTNIASNSLVVYSIQKSTDHNEDEDALLDGIVLNTSNIVPGSGFTLNASAINNSWGTYNINYKIIN